MSQEVIPLSSLGLDRPTFEAMIQHYRQIYSDGSDGNISHFRDQDVIKLKKVFDAFQDDLDLCGFLATLVAYVNIHFEKRVAREKKYDKSTIGMF